MKLSIHSWLTACSCILFLSGCSGDGLAHVSGKVTFMGKAVPAGKIYFAPDTTKGNKGSTGYANIKDGQFDTSDSGGKGVMTGAIIVKIEGTDPSGTGQKDKNDSSGEVLVKTLFTSYETSMEITGTTKKDFDVPADAGKTNTKGEKKFVQP